MDHETLIRTLERGREEFCFPPGLRTRSEAIASRLLGLLFPHFSTNAECDPKRVRDELAEIDAELRRLLSELSAHFEVPPAEAVASFLNSLGEIHERLIEDAHAIYSGDPAANSLDEVMLVYPGFLATSMYRLAHELHRLGFPLLPRLFTEWVHRRTGIDIHPGAKIGRRFFIDHGTGIVIGETTEIGDDVKLYQGVTLGALSVSKDLAAVKRHPTLEDRVVVYAHATILGGKTVVGRDSLIGGNVWLTSSVPPMSVVTRHSEVRVRTASTEEALDWII